MGPQPDSGSSISRNARARRADHTAIIITECVGEAVIDELFTHPDHRRQGLAEELLRHCMHVLHTLDLSTVTVTVDENNSAAMASTSPETSAASPTMAPNTTTTKKLVGNAVLET